MLSFVAQKVNDDNGDMEYKRVLRKIGIPYDNDKCDFLFMQDCGRAFQLYFKYGPNTTPNKNGNNNINKNKTDTSYLNKHLIFHGLNNPIGQDFNYTISRHKKTSLASLSLFMQANDGLEKIFPPRACCLYIVIDGSNYDDVALDEIKDSVTEKICSMRDTDAFGVCLFDQRSIKHFSHKAPDNHNSSDCPTVCLVRDARNKKFKEGGGMTGQKIIEEEEMVTDMRLFFTSFLDEREKRQGNSKTKKRDKLRGTNENFETGLLATLVFLEDERHFINKLDYFKQLVLIDHGVGRMKKK